MGKLKSFVDNQVILGNVAYTFYVPTTTSTKAEANHFHETVGSIVSVIDHYETTVLYPEFIFNPVINIFVGTLNELYVILLVAFKYDDPPLICIFVFHIILLGI